MEPGDFNKVRDFYNEEYHAHAAVAPGRPNWHSRLVARRIGDMSGKNVLDVACGVGEWLQLLQDRGANVSGVDISERAIDACRKRLPRGEFAVSTAESLPFDANRFDFISCLGSLEHFLDKPAALREMIRVARGPARILLLVPNAGFLTRRLGLYRGTEQTRIREDVWTLSTWRRLFEDAGLRVIARWRDLHPLSSEWICRGRPIGWPLRAAQAAALPLWPMAWQYQVHHLCEIEGRR